MKQAHLKCPAKIEQLQQIYRKPTSRPGGKLPVNLPLNGQDSAHLSRNELSSISLVTLIITEVSTFFREDQTCGLGVRAAIKLSVYLISASNIFCPAFDFNIMTALGHGITERDAALTESLNLINSVHSEVSPRKCLRFSYCIG